MKVLLNIAVIIETILIIIGFVKLYRVTRELRELQRVIKMNEGQLNT